MSQIPGATQEILLLVLPGGSRCRICSAVEIEIVIGGKNAMDAKFLGVGVVNAFGLWCLFLIFSVIAKVIATKYPISGVSDVILAGA